MGGNYYGTYYRFIYLGFMLFFIFLLFISCTGKLQNKENFSDEYKLMVASIVIFVFILLI